MLDNPASQSRLTDIHLSDTLDTLSARAWRTEAAVSYLASDCPNNTATGVAQLAYDLAEEIERLAETFGKEYALRTGENKVAA